MLWIESGLTWAYALMQRLDHSYMMRTSDCPSLKRKPSEYMREMFYSSQPMEKPDDKSILEATFKMIKADTQLLWSSDYPHWDFDTPGVIYDLPFLNETAKRNILGADAAAGVRTRYQGGEEGSITTACYVRREIRMLIPTAKSLRPLVLLLPLLTWINPSYALDYPTRPVRFIVSFAAGGPNDTIARILGQYLSEQLGQQFIVEDHVGAGGNIGMQDVLAAVPDGYTIGFVAPNNAINQTLYANIPFDFVRNSTPIAGTMKLANVMDVNVDFPAKTLAEFIAMAKAQPGKINFASGGVGTSPHMSGELLEVMAGIKLTHVSYRGTGPAMTDLQGGQIPVLFDNLPRLDPADQGRPHPRARRHHEGTRKVASRRADDRRNRARLRSVGVVRHQRAERHAA